MKIWIDVDNPPQVQYLLPFYAAFRAIGADVLVTARDYGFALDLMRERDVPFHAVGTSFGASRARKLVGTWQRSSDLVRLLRSEGVPDLVLCSSRPAAIAARRLGLPAFVIEDYEHSHLRLYRHTHATILYADPIDRESLLARGLRRDQLIPFHGIKEDITFSGIDLDAIPTHRFADLDDSLVRVLFRPPAEQSHYHRGESLELALATLDELARRSNVVVVYSPRAPAQVAYLHERMFVNPPLLLERPVPFVSLLKGVDAVISSGGTMLREAAYLGIPAVSIFRSEIGGVDRYLESLGRLKIIGSAAELSELPLEKGGRAPLLRSNPNVVAEIVATVLERAR